MTKKPEKNGKLIDDSQEDHRDIDYQCNFFGVPLPFLKQFANVAGFTGLYSFGALFTQTLASYIGSQIPTLEKQFGLSSYESGIIMTFNDIGFLLCIVIVAAIPRLVHVPRWLFGTMFLYSISGLICSLPHFLYPTAPINSLPQNTSTTLPVSRKFSFSLCSDLLSDNKTGGDSKMSSSRASTYAIDPNIKAVSIALIGIGMSLQGVAKAPRAPFTTVYLDDGCDKRKTGFFLGIIIGSSIFGPAISYGLGGFFSRLYVTLEDVDMSPKDPRWIGAWWLGFVVFGALTFVTALPMLCFPRYLADKNSQNYANKNKIPDKEKVELSRKEKVKERVLSYFRILKSPVYVCLLSSSLFGWSAIIGKYVFLSKYISLQFGMPLWKANIIVSAANLATVSAGTICGGTLTRRVKMSPRQCFLFITVMACILVVLSGSEMFIGCKQPTVVGPTGLDAKFANISDICHCKPREYFPICGTDDVTYHSPCYAGCSETLRNGRMYANCTVIPDGKASAGMCPFDCNMLYPFIAVNIVASFLSALTIMPSVTSKLRSVEDRDKGTGIGLQSSLGSLLAAIPVPILFGKVIDTTCLLWKSDSARKGSCLFYNIEDFRFRMFGVSLIYRLCGMVAIFIALKLVWNIHDWNDLWKGKSSIKKEGKELLVISTGSTHGDQIRSVK